MIKRSREKETLTWGGGDNGLPLLGMLLLSKGFIVVTLGRKKLFVVRLAIELAFQGSVVANIKYFIALLATDASFVEYTLILDVLQSCLFSDVHGAATGSTLLLGLSNKRRHG